MAAPMMSATTLMAIVQVPSTWFLDSVFALANAEDASDLEHASFAARKARSGLRVYSLSTLPSLR